MISSTYIRSTSVISTLNECKNILLALTLDTDLNWKNSTLKKYQTNVSKLLAFKQIKGCVQVKIKIKVKIIL